MDVNVKHWLEHTAYTIWESFVRTKLNIYFISGVLFSFFGVKPFFFNFETCLLRRTTQVEVVVVVLSVVLSVVLPAGDSMLLLLLPLQLLLFLFGTKANRPPPCRRCPDPALVRVVSTSHHPTSGGSSRATARSWPVDWNKN